MYLMPPCVKQVVQTQGGVVMTRRHLALMTRLVVFLGMAMGVSAGLAQEPAEAPRQRQQR